MTARIRISGRSLAFFAILAALGGLFAFVAVKTGPFATVPVTVATVAERSVSPAIFGIGNVEARRRYAIGPVATGRLLRLDVAVGERVREGQTLGEMDPADLPDRIRAQEAAAGRAEAAVRAAVSQLDDARARLSYADSQSRRFEKLVGAKAVSLESAESWRKERAVAGALAASAGANLAAARQELERTRAEREALLTLLKNLRLTSPVNGLVVSREGEPGSTISAGQPVIELVDPESLRVHARIDQTHASGLKAGLSASIVLRSAGRTSLPGSVFRVEPLADEVTEEILAKVAFDRIPEPLPSIGELVEVTIALPVLPPSPVIPAASLASVGGRTGVWTNDDGRARFVPVTPGESDLDGNLRILSGLRPGERVVVYSARPLDEGRRISVVERIRGTAP
jgi:RND family efflux transporter MFP subunit